MRLSADHFRLRPLRMQEDAVARINAALQGAMKRPLNKCCNAALTECGKGQPASKTIEFRALELTPCQFACL